jgi:hypothetical protein
MMNELKAEEEATRISMTTGVLGDNSQVIEKFAKRAENVSPVQKP